MPNILIGADVSEHVGILSQKLKKSAIEQFSEREAIDGYTPWIAAGNTIDFDFPKSLLMPVPSTIRGQLVNDDMYLAPAREYVEARLGRMTYHKGLMPGARADWLPSKLTNKSAIAAVGDGIQVLRGSNSSFDTLYGEMVESVLPLGDKHRGYSNAWMRGILFRGIPDQWNEYDVAIDLAHELGHHALFVWQSIDGILTSRQEALVLSSVRRVRRPAIQSFHGAVALSFMLFAAQNWPKNSKSTEVRTRHGGFYIGGTLESALDEALTTLRAQCTFTAVGQKMINEMQALLDS